MKFEPVLATECKLEANNWQIWH